MASYDSYLSGQLRNVLQVYGEKAAKAAKEALAKNADDLCNLAKAKCPVKTGNLRDSIHIEKRRGGSVCKVVADAKDAKGRSYARVVEFSPKIDEPFMYPAWDELHDRMKQNVINAIKGEIANDKH